MIIPSYNLKLKYMNFIERCRNYKYANIVLALVFALTLFLQCCFFHYQLFSSILISSLWKCPLDFIIFYLPKIAIAISDKGKAFPYKGRLLSDS